MAGSGTKLWATGDTVSASEFQSYVQDQTIAVFDDATARDAAFGGAGEPTLAEGMCCYLKNSTNEFQIYSGSAWVPLLDLDTWSVSSGAYTIKGDVTLGVDDTGHDLICYGATSGAYMKWNQTTDDLQLVGAAGLDIAGDLDVDGTTNLDVVDIDGTCDMASTVSIGSDLTVSGGDIQLGTTTGGETLTITGVATASGGGDPIQIKAGNATGTNVNGGYLLLSSGLGTGSGSGGDILIQTSPSGSSGTTQNTATTIMTLTGASPRRCLIANNEDISPDSAGTGQLTMSGDGYGGFIAMNGTGMYIGHNSGSRQTYLMTDETVGIEIDTSQRLICVGTYNITTAAAANMHVAATGLFYRSTSSAKYKTAVEDVADSYADQVLNLRPVWYRSLGNDDRPDWSHWGLIAEEVADIDPRLVTYGSEYESDPDTGAVLWDSEPVLDDDGNQTYKQIEGVDENGDPTLTDGDPVTRKTNPRMVLDDDGNPVSAPEGVQYDRIVPLLINIIKRQDARLAALETAA